MRIELAGFLAKAAAVIAIGLAINCGNGTSSPDGGHDTGAADGGLGGAGAGGADGGGAGAGGADGGGGTFGCAAMSCGVGTSYCAHPRTGGGIGGRPADAGTPPPPIDDGYCVPYPSACSGTPTCACLCQSVCFGGDSCQCSGTPPMSIHCVGS